MLSAIFALFFTVSISIWFSQKLKREHPETDLRIFRLLIVYHLVLSIVYYWYASLYSSDAWEYHYRAETLYRGSDWLNYYGVSTAFIESLAFILVNFLGYSFEACMIQFSWLGLMGFFYFYVVLKERLRYDHRFFGFSLLTLVLFLPNLHFWSSSMGKGSVIFFGFALFFYALNDIGKRYISGIIGAIVIYHVRPHILFVVLLAATWGFVFSSRGVRTSVRVGVILMTLIAFWYIREDVLALTGISEDDIFGDSTTLSSRASGLQKANSGVDLQNYSFIMKLFTFWFRPLFIDAPGILGIVVSFENLFYAVIFSRLFRTDFIAYFRRSDHVVKASALTFLGVSFALAQIAGNLGLAMRQKSQVMILMMFVILKFMDERRARAEDLEAQRQRMQQLRDEQRKKRIARNVAGITGQALPKPEGR